MKSIFTSMLNGSIKFNNSPINSNEVLTFLEALDTRYTQSTNNNDIQWQFNTNSNDNTMYRALANNGIDNIIVNDTLDMSHVSILYYENFKDKVIELITTGRIYLTDTVQQLKDIQWKQSNEEWERNNK
ncbi:hypothetical protein [Clostridium estertheticum]|uniref:hypothetical protein n=1 Tax=Clostridium estertheticum TaxID=238834 RepID=UPI001C0B404A|nr:hypothetical protein [Clostridium estertheticum]MBU3186621.1 hypothetical protein [Clostridium estertheticum]